MNFKQNLFRTFFGQAISSGFILLIGVITARMLGAEGRGLYTLFFTTSGLCVTFLNLGFGQANVYYLNQEHDTSIVLGNSILFIIISVIILGIFLFFVKLFGWVSLFREQSVLFFFIFGFSVFFSLTERVFTGIVMGQHLFLHYSNNLIFQSFLIFNSTIILLFLSFSVDVLITSRVVVMGIVLIWYSYVMYKKIKPQGFLLNFSLFFRQIKFGMMNYTQNLIGLLNYKIYIYILAIFSGKKSVGIFSVALLFVELVRFIPNSVGTILFPKLSSIKNRNECATFAAVSLRNAILLSGLVFITVMASAKFIVSVVFGIEYIEVPRLLFVMLPGAMFATIYQILTRYFTSQKQQMYSIISGVISLVVVLALSINYTPKYGTLGSAIAFLFGGVTNGGMMLIFFIFTTKIKLWKILCFTIDDFKRYFKFIHSMKF